MRRVTRAANLLLLLLTCTLLPWAHAAADPPAPDPFKSGTFDPPRDAPDFELPGSNGAPLKLSHFRGKLVVLAFGFTHCPRICPVTLATLQQVAKKLGPAASALQVVFVTVDPARDDAARMKEYLALFNPAFLGATGTAAQLEAVRAEYGITAKKELSKDAAIGYEVHHSSFFYIVDQRGKLRLLVPFGKPADDIVHDLELLLKP